VCQFETVGLVDVPLAGIPNNRAGRHGGYRKTADASENLKSNTYELYVGRSATLACDQILSHSPDDEFDVTESCSFFS